MARGVGRGRAAAVSCSRPRSRLPRARPRCPTPASRPGPGRPRPRSSSPSPTRTTRDARAGERDRADRQRRQGDDPPGGRRLAQGRRLPLVRQAPDRHPSRVVIRRASKNRGDASLGAGTVKIVAGHCPSRSRPPNRRRPRSRPHVRPPRPTRTPRPTAEPTAGSLAGPGLLPTTATSTPMPPLPTASRPPRRARGPFVIAAVGRHGTARSRPDRMARPGRPAAAGQPPAAAGVRWRASWRWPDSRGRPSPD